MKKRIVTAVFALFVAFNTLAAQYINTDGLTEEQKAQLALQAAQMKKQSEDPATTGIVDKLTDPKELNEWVELGKNVGLSLAAVAKELGVASDEFLKSNTGKIAVVIIVWKVMGHDILGIVGGTVAWIVLATIILWSFKFFHMTKRVKQEDKTYKYERRFEFKSNDARVGSGWAHSLSLLAITVICMHIIFG